MRLPRRAAQDGGYTMIDVLLVVLILGVLAATALSSMLVQTSRAQDISAQSTVSYVTAALKAEWVGAGGTYPTSPEQTVAMLDAVARSSGYRVQPYARDGASAAALTTAGWHPDAKHLAPGVLTAGSSKDSDIASVSFESGGVATVCSRSGSGTAFCQRVGEQGVLLGAGGRPQAVSRASGVDEPTARAALATSQDVEREVRVSDGLAAVPRWQTAIGNLDAQASDDGGYDTVANTSGLIGRWKLDETSGTVTRDDVGGNDGAYKNAPTLAQPRLKGAGTSALFNGTNQYATIPWSASMTPQSQFTIEATVQLTDVPAKAGIFNLSRVSGTSGALLYLTTNGRPAAQVYGNAGTSYTATAPANVLLNPGQTVDLAATFSAGTLTLWMDGVPISTTSAAYTPSTSGAAQIGTYGSGTFFPGFIDEVAVYDRALSAQELRDHHRGV